MVAKSQIKKLQDQTLEILFPWRVFPEEAILDEQEKDRRLQALPDELLDWCMCRYERFCELEARMHQGLVSDGEAAEADLLQTVKQLMLAYWWGPPKVSAEAETQLERLRQLPVPDRLPEDFAVSEPLDRYLATDPESRFEDLKWFRNDHRAAFMRTMKRIRQFGGSRRVRAPLDGHTYPGPMRLLFFGELQEQRACEQVFCPACRHPRARNSLRWN